MLTVYSEKQLLHHPPKEMVIGRFIDYRETPSRAETIIKAIRDRNVGDVVAPVDRGLAPILAVHTEKYVSYFQTAYEKWIEIGGNPDGVFPDTFAVRLSQIYQDISDGGAGGRPGFFSYDMTAIIAKDTYTAAYEAAQVATTGAEILASEKRRAVFALCRPPGHHSSEDLAGGYCFFNNAGIAAEHLIKHHGFGNVVILDIDYHHGNGTQAIFYKRRNPMYASIHGDPDYPYFWGRAEETGEGEGKGANVNVPLPIGTGDDEYLAALDALIANHIVPYGIQALVVSLGVDTFGGDPVGSFNLTSACFERIGERLARIGVPTLFVMEGGYAVSEIGTNVTNVLLAFERAAGSQ